MQDLVWTLKLDNVIILHYSPPQACLVGKWECQRLSVRIGNMLKSQSVSLCLLQGNLTCSLQLPSCRAWTFGVFSHRLPVHAPPAFLLGLNEVVDHRSFFFLSCLHACVCPVSPSASCYPWRMTTSHPISLCTHLEYKFPCSLSVSYFKHCASLFSHVILNMFWAVKFGISR